MRIMRRGREVPKLFECGFCGCQFSAELKEFIVESLPSFQGGYLLSCECPNCGLVCEEVMRDDN